MSAPSEGATPAPGDARDEILARIRGALAASPGAAPTAVSPERRLDAADGLVDRFVERVEDYRATVTRASEDEIAATVATICRRHAVATLAVPDGVPAGWVPEDVDVLAVTAIDPAAVRALDAVDGVLTTSALAVAETGTIVLDAGPGQGPRAATLLPDLHVCVVSAAAVVPGVPEMVAAMETSVRDNGRPLTMVSGPSATSDIELDRVEGVHGPRRLEVVVVVDAV